MKFLHIADLHIGKNLNQKSLIEDQKVILDQIIKQMEDNNINVLLLAGDIYDKQVPSKEAVSFWSRIHRLSTSESAQSWARITREHRVLKGSLLRLQTLGQQFKLGGLAGTVGSFQYD